MKRMKMKRELSRFLAVFIAGGFLYCLCELVWRQWTHWSMFIAGGLCFYLIGRLNERAKKKGKYMPLPVQMLVSGIVVTAVELIFGIVLNRWFGLQIWDYSQKKFNFLGQICLGASASWALLSAIPIVVDDVIGWLFFGEPYPFRRGRQNRGNQPPELEARSGVNLLECFEIQDEIIRRQSSVIQKLMKELLQYREVSEMDDAMVDEIKEISLLRREVIEDD